MDKVSSYHFHKASTSGTQTENFFSRVSLNSFQVVTPCHPLVVWYILHQVAAPLFKTLKSMLGHIPSGYSVILHVILHVLNPLARLQLTHRSRKYKLISIHPLLVHGFWGGIREIERDTHNTNNSFQKTDFICGCRKNIKQMTPHNHHI